MSSDLGLRVLCILLGALSGCFCEHCREGAKYSGAIISPKLEVTKIMQVPHAVSMSDCSTACCDLSDCDLAWMFEHHCYLVSCQHKGNCEPKKMEKVRSYLTFVLRPQRLTALLGYRQVPPNSMSLREDPSEEISSLKELAFLGKEHSLEEAEDYPDEYGQMEQNPFQLSIKHEGGNVNYADWGMIVTAENTFNASGLTHRDNHEELSGNEKQNVNLEKPMDINESKSEGNPVTKHPREHSEVTSDPMEKSANELGFQLPSEANSPLPGEVVIPSHTPPPPDILKLISTATVQASDLGGIKEDETMSLPSSGPATQPSATVQVPLSTVATKTASRKNQPPVAVVSPKAQEISFPTTSTFIDGDQSTDDTKIVSYNWEEIEGPLREKASADTPILHLSNLIPGNYTFRLTVIDADGAANSTLASLRVNKQVDFPPVANAGPNQKITLPQNTITLNGNQSKDDHEIVSYEWSLSPQSKDKMVVMEGIKSPYLQLSSLQEGNYTFQLTVSDSVKQQSTAEVKVTVQPKKNTAPKAVVGPYKELTFPVQSTILDGSMSTDDVGIVYYHWENISGPSSLQMENVDSAVATVSGLEVGTYYFRLTVKDDQGLSSSATLSVTVKEEKNHPPEAHAGGKHILVLPNNSIALDGSQSTNDQGIVSYLWIRDGQSPAAGDVIHGSDHDAVLQLTNLVEGSYIFHLKVMDAKGDSDIDTAIVEVQPDPKRNSLVELILQIRVGQLTEQQKDALVRQLAMVLNVLDSEIKVQKIQPYSDASTAIVFYVQKGRSSRALEALDVAQMLRSQLLKEKIKLPFKMLRIDTAACLLQCSGHGYCDPITKRCICHQLWMENLIEWYLGNGKSNCEWSILYVTTFAFVLIVLLANLTWFCLCYCKSRKRTKIRKKTKYTILDNIDDQERMELQPKYGIKHRSTEHNSSLMVSESEFDSDQDTIFSREKTEKEKPNNSPNGSIKNGVSFSYSSKDR